MALERLRVLKKIDALREDGLKLRQALKAVELPSSTHHDWRRALAARGVAGLVLKSRRPRRCASPRWTKRDERRVLTARDARPYCGKRRIHHELKRQKAGCDFSVSTVGRILARAAKRGRVRPCSFYRGRVAPKRGRDFSKGHARRWRYGERAKAPGELVQIDHMTVRLDGAELKEFRAVCRFTRRMFARVYSRATAFNARHFFREFLDFMRVVSAQVDGGSEFMAEFEAEDANAEYQDYLRYYNDERPHRGIDMMTPNQFHATLQDAA